MRHVEIRLLGGFEARPAGGISAPLPKKTQALLAYLALTPGTAHPRDKLATLLWGERADAHAQDSLRHALSAIRRAFPSPLLNDGQGVSLSPDAAEVDVACLQEAMSTGTPDGFERAVDLYRGDLLEGLVVDEEPFEAWLLVERERLRELVLEALARLVSHHTAAGQVERAVRSAQRLLALDPLQEAAHRTLMRLYLRQSRRGAALQQYQICVGVLQRELAADPEPETQALYREMLRPLPEDAPPYHGGGTPPPAVHETPLIGRQAVLDQLTHTLEDAVRRQPGVVLVAGEAGVGKSRVVGELGSRAEALGGRVLVARCYETEQVLPFGPWLDALRKAGLTAEDRALRELDPVARGELTRLFPELGPPPNPLAAPDNPRPLFDGVAALLARLTARAPLVVVLEDVQWADEMSLRFLAWFSRRLGSAPILVAITVRDDSTDPVPLLDRALDELRGAPRFVSLTLPPLTEAEVLALVRAAGRTGSDAAAVARLGRQVWAASDGNPFVALETLHALQDGTIVVTGDAIAVPDSVREVVRRRLEALSEPGGMLLRVAATIGCAFDFPLLRGAAGLSDEDTAAGLEELVRHRLLQGVDERFDFTHDRIRQVIEDRLLKPTRQLLHAAVGRALERLNAQDPAAVYDRLAYHWARTDEPAKAVAYLILFAERAAHGYAHADAADALGEALVQAGRLPPADRDLAQVDVVLRQVRSLSYLGQLDEAFRRLQFARPIVQRLGESRIAARYYFLLGNTESLRGEGEQATAAAFCALEEARRVGDEPTLGRAHFLLSLEGFWSGRLAEGVEHGREAVRRLAPAGRGNWLGLAHWVLGFNHTLLGEFEAALAAEDRARAIGEALGDARLQSAAAWTMGGIHALVGDATNAVAACRRGLELSPDPLNTAIARGWLGYAYLVAGEADRAVAAMSEAVAHYERFRFRAHGWFTGWLAEAYLARGDVATAEKLAANALVLATAAGQAYGAGIAERALGLVLTRAGGPPTHLEQARATFARIGARFEVARTDLELAALAARTGRLDAARDHAASSEAAFVALGVARYVGRADAWSRPPDGSSRS